MADIFKSERIPSTYNWQFSPSGQHMDLGIAEMNLFTMLSALGLSHSIFGERLLPVGTLHEPFIERGLDALNYACQDARFILAATPSGVTLARRTLSCRPGSNGIVVSSDAGRNEYILHRYFAPRPGENMEILIDKAIGKKVKSEVVQSEPWRPQFLVAKSFGRGRVFIAACDAPVYAYRGLGPN